MLLLRQKPARRGFLFKIGICHATSELEINDCVRFLVRLRFAAAVLCSWYTKSQISLFPKPLEGALPPCQPLRFSVYSFPTSFLFSSLLVEFQEQWEGWGVIFLRFPCCRSSSQVSTACRSAINWMPSAKVASACNRLYCCYLESYAAAV